MMERSQRKNTEPMFPLHSRVIMVLGCRPFQKDGSINPEIRARVGKGVEVYQRGFGNKIIFSGINQNICIRKCTAVVTLYWMSEK